MTQHATSTASAVARRITSARERFFFVDDFPDYSRTAVARSLARLSDDGELYRVRRGMYWRGVHTPVGMTPPNALSVLEAIYGKDAAVGPARLEAAGMLGLTTQVAATPTFAVPYLVEGIAFELISRDRRRCRQRYGLNRFEVALLEVLSDWENLNELAPRQAMQRFAKLIRDKEVRPDAVAHGANTEPPVVRESLRDILLATQEDAAASRIRPTSVRVPVYGLLPNWPSRDPMARHQ